MILVQRNNYFSSDHVFRAYLTIDSRQKENKGDNIEEEAEDKRKFTLKKEKQTVKNFYDNYGWHKKPNGMYLDTATFVDMRPVLQGYYHKMHMRVNNFIKPEGEYFLDAGSGAVPHREYLEYSKGYKRHICVDISEKALTEARSKLKDRGFYVLADLTKLPFKSGTFDAAVCAHALYHIPQEEQEPTVLELYKTLKTNRDMVLIYTWPTSLPTKIALLFRQIIRSLQQPLSKIPGFRSLWKNDATDLNSEKESTQPTHPPLYFKPYDYRWFKDILPDNWDVDIRCWRSVDKIFTTTLVPDNFAGRVLMELIFLLENIFPHALAKIGRYAMIIIRK